MTVTEFPVIKHVFESGAEDRIYDSLVIVGPIIVVLIVVTGRSIFTRGLAVSYLLIFCTHLLIKAFSTHN